jgi:hypothetical protein
MGSAMSGSRKVGEKPPNRAERRQAAKASRICVYCGRPEGGTDDHVPPKNLFHNPKPSELITVPCCEDCRKPTTKDDEYFRLKLGLNQEVGMHPVAKEKIDVIMRSLQKPQARGLLGMVAADMRLVEMRTPAGLYLGTRAGYEVDLARIDRVIARTVRGLFFHETKRRLPDDFDVRVFCDDRLLQELPEVLEQLNKTIIQPLAEVDAKVIADGAFMYRHRFTADNLNASVWALSFYQGKSFLALIVPKEPTIPAKKEGPT